MFWRLFNIFAPVIALLLVFAGIWLILSAIEWWREERRNKDD